MLAKGVNGMEGSIFMMNRMPAKSEVEIVRRANLRDTSRFLLVDKKLLNDSKPPCVFFNLVKVCPRQTLTAIHGKGGGVAMSTVLFCIECEEVFVEISNKESHFNDKINFHRPQCSIEHGIEKTVVSIPPNRLMVVVVFFEFIDIF
jgi:hypothetical protein